MISRRRFLATAGAAPAAALFAPDGHDGLRDVVDALARHPGTPRQVAEDEDFWMTVQQAFTVDRSIINLNNGGVSPAPRVVQDAMKRHLDFSNQAPVYTMWRVLEPQREPVRAGLARMFGCDAEEVAVTRGASESLQICQNGFDLRRGDEVVTSDQDYPRMITTWQQRERREGIVLRQVQIPVPAEDPDEVVRRFEAAITPQTRLLHVSHMINLTGQVLPVRQIVQMARRRGIPVIVDGAHAFAHFPFTRDALDADYYASSLHKWLYAPHGTGLLYVRRDRIPGLWPLQAAEPRLDANIRKFEEIGTHPAANFLAVAEALVFSEAIGLERKAARMVYLRDRWARALMRHDRVRMHTSLRPGLAYGLANFSIDGIDSGALVNHLFNAHRILATSIKHAAVEGVRVTPNVYTTPQEIDVFIGAVEKVIRDGLPAA
ncbi:aminotransferase class V-fold PLP-dependent enzyme [Longimicrobium sp.]|uniref:aminotransferase class V-fold PLP-dependent enzyme n=1 Tax=Longimicrobium sp. TaxID=2029185 RepID=UPI002E37FC6E|nr:aminotransferase class V-fold PLP-dependent enzyme [Longimicrobium sp.]HEX6039403.1 aminotransferase class V-fold PLP-dependent enzyme [Longimicrobium sp.]